MRLLSKPLSRKEIKESLDLLDGNISRICVSDDPEEIMSNLGFAIDRLSMIAYSGIKEIGQQNENDI